MSEQLERLRKMTDKELNEEHAAAYWFFEGSYDDEMIKRAEQCIYDCEKVMAERKCLKD